MEETKWTSEDEAALDARIQDAPRLMRERLLMREAEARVQRERDDRRRERLRRLTFGLLGR